LNSRTGRFEVLHADHFQTTFRNAPGNGTDALFPVRNLFHATVLLKRFKGCGDLACGQQFDIAVRQELKANGTLASEDNTFRILVQRQDMTGADRGWANHYEPGDVIRYAPR